jgi:hypothetical protein
MHRRTCRLKSSQAHSISFSLSHPVSKHISIPTASALAGAAAIPPPTVIPRLPGQRRHQPPPPWRGHGCYVSASPSARPSPPARVARGCAREARLVCAHGCSARPHVVCIRCWQGRNGSALVSWITWPHPSRGETIALRVELRPRVLANQYGMH